MRPLLLTLALVSLTFAAAQGRLNAPTYYLSQLPELQAGDTVRGELTTDSAQNFKDGSYLDLYLLYGEVGEVVMLKAESLEFDTFLSLFGPDGQLVAWNDDGYYSADAELSVPLPETGRYLLVVSGYAQRDLGRYTLTRGLPPTESEPLPLPAAGSVTESFDEIVAVDVPYLGTPGAVYALELTERTTLAIRAESETFDTYLLLTDDRGEYITENDDERYTEATGWDTNSLLFAQLEPGAYRLYLTSYFGLPHGEFTLTVQRFVPAD